MAILKQLGQWLQVIFIARRSIAQHEHFRHIIKLAACHFFEQLEHLPVYTIIGGAG